MALTPRHSVKSLWVTKLWDPLGEGISFLKAVGSFSGLLDALLSSLFHFAPISFQSRILVCNCMLPSLWNSIQTSGGLLRSRGATLATPDNALYSSALNHHIHSVKTASIGTLGRSRPPMPVVVPSAPEVQETTRMLEDSESVSSLALSQDVPRGLLACYWLNVLFCRLRSLPPIGVKQI